MPDGTIPISKVMVMEDRAQVERRGAVQLAAGRSVLRLEGVSTLVVDRSLHASVAGAKVVEARVLRGEYPPGYKPKRPTKVMPPRPDLAPSIPDLAAYLQ